MLFKNKIEYTKGMFVEIYGTEIKKVRLVLRIITGIAVVAAESDGTFTDEKMQKERTPWRTYPSFY